MDPAKTDVVIYVDHTGAEHKALVTAINGLNPRHLSLVYIDPKADERENVKQVYDVQYLHDQFEENNPDLPKIHLNCWKFDGEEHTVAASDHPMFDHPFAPKPTDEDGRVIEKPRPEYDAQVAAHLESNPDVKIVDGTIESASGAPEVAISSGDVTVDAQQGTATTSE